MNEIERQAKFVRNLVEWAASVDAPIELVQELLEAGMVEIRNA